MSDCQECERLRDELLRIQHAGSRWEWFAMTLVGRIQGLTTFVAMETLPPKIGSALYVGDAATPRPTTDGSETA